MQACAATSKWLRSEAGDGRAHHLASIRSRRSISRSTPGRILCDLFSAVAAPAVRPDDRVVNYVSVHAGPSSGSPTIGQLRPQQTAPLVSSQPGWYGIRLSDGTTGFVARGWTIVFDDQPASAAPFRLHLD